MRFPIEGRTVKISSLQLVGNCWMMFNAHMDERAQPLSLVSEKCHIHAYLLCCSAIPPVLLEKSWASTPVPFHTEIKFPGGSSRKCLLPRYCTPNSCPSTWFCLAFCSFKKQTYKQTFLRLTFSFLSSLLSWWSQLPYDFPTFKPRVFNRQL